MIVDVISFIVMIIGAVIAYGASKFAPYVLKGEDRDRDADIAMIKLVGFVIALVGALVLVLTNK